MRHRGTYRYIESKKRQTKMHRARKVCDRASPDHSHKTDETSGIDLTQRSEGRKTSGREWVWMLGIDLTRGRGKVKGASGWECVD